VLTALVTLVFALHISGGALALLSGILAIAAPKGGRLHRLAGNVFFASMLIMAAFAAVLAVIRPGQIINLFIAGFTLYLVATAWLTARRPDGSAGAAEKAALAAALILCAPFALVMFQLATGVAVFKSAFAIKGPILIALVTFSGIMALAAAGDACVVLSGGLSGRSRIARHLWRMCVGLGLASGSAFTNGFARLLPGPYHVPPLFFLPQFIPMVLLIYWMARVWLSDAGDLKPTPRGGKTGSPARAA
jgi:uncharacterized membrane protein